MTFFRVRRSTGGDQRGVAMVELAIVAPLLLLLAFGVTDISRIVISHTTMTQVAREALRQASADKNLEIGTFMLLLPSGLSGSPSCTTGFSSCPRCYFPNPPPALGRDHSQNCVLQLALRLLSQRKNDVYINWNTLRITSVRIDPAATPPPGVIVDEDSLRFTIQANYQGFFNLFSGTQITATALGPYL